MHTVSLGQQHLLNCLKIKDRERRGENEKKTLLQRPSHPRAPLESREGAVSREDRRRRKHLSRARAGALPALHSLSPPARAVDAETGTQSEPPHTPGQTQYLPPSWEDPHHTCGTWNTWSGQVVDLCREPSCVFFCSWSHSGSPSPRKGPGSHQGSEGMGRVCP